MQVGEHGVIKKRTWQNYCFPAGRKFRSRPEIARFFGLDAHRSPEAEARHVQKAARTQKKCSTRDAKHAASTAELRGWSAICELLNRWELLYETDTGEKYGYAEAMLEQDYDELSQIVNMSREELEALSIKIGMRQGHVKKLVKCSRERDGMRQVRVPSACAERVAGCA